MPLRKVWTEVQDKILRLLKEQRALKKWSLIAKTMDQQFFIKGRTGKQCRQRYHNCLDSNIITTQWTLEQENILFQMHQEVGNKWSVISQRLLGRSDNCVKNHFYSKLRKSTRKLNKLILPKYQSNLRQIKNTLLYKIIQATEDRFKIQSKLTTSTIQKCVSIKNRLFKLESLDENVQLDESTIELIKDIIQCQEIIKRTMKPMKSLQARRTKGPHKHTTDLMDLQSKQGKQKPIQSIMNEPFYQKFMKVFKDFMIDRN